ncbi:MAG: hypothetical protein AAGJ96_04100 [Pseudomonadota bacterium]
MIAKRTLSLTLVVLPFALAACAAFQATAGPECELRQLSTADTILLNCPDEGVFAVRIAGLDAPDINSTACELERVRGRAALGYAQALLQSAQSVRVLPAPPEAGERAAQLIVDGEDYATIMMSTGQGMPSALGRTDWCAREVRL